MKTKGPVRRRQIRRKKKGICQFLLEKLEDRSFELAQWTDKEKGEFRLHWLHASSGSWTVETDSELFRLWALHKGRLADKKKYKTLKANFRCAMKSRYELEEIKEPHNSGRKDVKFWRFTDFSFAGERTAAADPGQKENREEGHEGGKRCQTTETTKNSRRRGKKRKPAEEKEEEWRATDAELHIRDLDFFSESHLYSLPAARDDFALPLTEEMETTYFMNILEQDKSAREELVQFGSPSYDDLHPVCVDEPNRNCASEIDHHLVADHLVSGQMERALPYEYRGPPTEHFYSDPISRETRHVDTLQL